MMVWKWYDWMIVVWWFVSCVCEWRKCKQLWIKYTHFFSFSSNFKLRNTTQSTSLSFRFLQLFHFMTWLDNIMKTSEDQVIIPSVVIRFDVVYPRVSPEDPEEQKCSFLFFLLSIIFKNIKRSSGSSSKVRIGTNSNQIAAEDHPYTIFRFSAQVFIVFRNGGVRSLFS